MPVLQPDQAALTLTATAPTVLVFGPSWAGIVSTNAGFEDITLAGSIPALDELTGQIEDTQVSARIDNIINLTAG